MAQIPASTLSMLARPFMPLAKRRAAGYAADYLNNRRQARLVKSLADVAGESIDPDVLVVLCERRARASAKEAKGLPWPLVVASFVGAGIGAAVSYVLLNQGRRGNF